MQAPLWVLASIVMLFLLPTFLVASAAVDLKARWLRYGFSILFWPLSMFAGLYYFTIVMPSPEADGPASIWLVFKGAGIAFVFALFWTWCFRRVVPNRKSKLK